MWPVVVRVLMQLLRWSIMHFVAKPLIKWGVIRPLSKLLLEGISSDGAVLEGVMEADVEDVVGTSIDMEEMG